MKLEKPDHQTLEHIDEEPATCTESGIKRGCWKCPDCGEYFDDQERTKVLSKKEVVEPAKGHQYNDPNDPVWTWANGFATATATFTCTVCHQQEPKKATVTSKTTASCTTEGKTVYTAAVKFKNKTCKKEETVNSEKIPHSYGTPKWSWAADYTTATATFACKKCNYTTETKDSTPTSETITDSTCKAAGKIKHTAVVEFGGEKYSDVKNETLPLGRHNFGEPKWTWAKDNKSATAKFTCGTCKKSATVPADNVTKDVPEGLNCGKAGDVKYTASVTFEEQFYTGFKTEQIVLDHTLIHFSKVSAKCETDGNEEYWECNVCRQKFGDKAGSKKITDTPVIPATGHTLELVKDKLYKCTVCNGTFTITLSPDGTTRIYSVEEDAVILQDEAENDNAVGYSDEENQNETELIIEESPSQSDLEENEQNEESTLNEQREEGGQNEDENNNGDIPDVPENAARYGLIYPEGEEADPVETDAWEESTVNLRAESARNGAAQSVQAQQQQRYPLWISVTMLAVLAGMVMFFILRRKSNR